MLPYLHPGLNDIQRCISKNASRSRCCSKHGCDDWVHFFPGIIPLEVKSKHALMSNPWGGKPISQL